MTCADLNDETLRRAEPEGLSRLRHPVQVPTHFFGISDNAIKTQVWIAVAACVLAVIVAGF